LYLSNDELIEIALIYKDQEQEGFDCNNRTLLVYVENLCKTLIVDLQEFKKLDWSQGF